MNALENEKEAGTGAQGKLRAFIALKTPAEWDEQLANVQGELRTRLPSKAIRWVKPEQIHVTLRFFGNVRPEEVVKITDILQQLVKAMPALRLSCGGLGCFPSSIRPRVIWVGLTGDLHQIEALQSAVVEGTRQFGEPPEDRPFRPHLTLARVQNLERTQTRELEKALEGGVTIEREWTVREMLLMRSHLSSQGARHEELRRFTLGG
jgi:2'-5' RNA ligase